MTGVLRTAGSFPSPQWEQRAAPALEQGRVELQGRTRLRGSGTHLAAHSPRLLHSPLSQPCPSSLPSTPLHWDIPWVGSFPVETRRKGVPLAQCWAGQAPCGALAASEGSPVLGHHQESPDRDAQPYAAHRESCGAGQVLHPACEDCQTCRRFNVSGKVGCLFLRDKYSLPFSES